MSVIFGLLSLAAIISVTAAFLAFFPRVARVVMNEDAPSRVSALDGLRGVLALSVFLHHSLIAHDYHQGHGWQAPAGNFDNLLGRGAVALFFMISAYLFWGRIVGKRSAEIDWPGFFRGRCLRLIPMYAASVGMLLIVVGIETGGTLRVPLPELVAEIVRWFSFAFLGTPNVNGLPHTSVILSVLWSLKFEWIFYLGLPVAAAIYRRLGRTWPIYLAVFVLSLKGGEFSFYGFFVMGALAVHVLGQRWGGMARAMWAVGGLAALVTLVACFHDIEGPLQAALLLPVFVAALEGGVASRIFQCKPLRFLGHISYSVYLIHTIIIHLLVRYVIGAPLYAEFGGLGLYMTVISMGLAVVAVSTVTFLMIEKPFLEIGKSTRGLRSLAWLAKSSRARAGAARVE